MRSPRKIKIFIGGWSLLTSLGLSACQSLPLPAGQPLSGLDQKYKLKKKLIAAPAEGSVLAYQNIFALTLYSNCKWYPSDSNFAQVAQKKCGTLRGGLMAFSRFLMEEDAVRMGYPLVIYENHLESVDFPDECWL